MSTNIEVETYGVRVGTAYLTVDFKAQAIAVVLGASSKVTTEDLGNGVLVDRDETGRIVGVEIIAGRAGTA